jgi:hypothetical protein
MEDQAITPSTYLPFLKELNIPFVALSITTGIPTSSLSLFFSGKRGLSTRAQVAMLRAMKFFAEVGQRAASAGVPADFHNLVAIQELWTEHCYKNSEDQVIRTDEELSKK